jgi:hypothetical protein
LNKIKFTTNFLLLILIILCLSTVTLGAEPFIVSSTLTSDKDGNKETHIFGPEQYCVYWTGIARNLSKYETSWSEYTWAQSYIKKHGAFAEWYSPDGKLFHTEDIKFDQDTKKAIISFSLGDNPWTRVPEGNWVLNIKRRDGQQGVTETFTVEPVNSPEKYKDLYIKLLSNYQKYYMECSGLMIDEHAVLTNTEITDFKNENCVHSLFTYDYNFNDIKTNPQSRASTVIMGILLKTIKSMYKNFIECPDIKEYMTEISYYHYNFVSKDTPILETTKLIVKPSEIKKYIDMEITAQDLVKSSIIIINDERVELTLQPI